MRHLKKGRKLSRTPSHRKAMFRNMATSLVECERIETTHSKALDLRGEVERLVTMAKKALVFTKDAANASDAQQKQRLEAAALHKRRLIASMVKSRVAVQKLMGELATRYENRPGGYTRVVKIDHRRGDHAPVSLIEFLPGAAPVAVEAEKVATASAKKNF